MVHPAIIYRGPLEDRIKIHLQKELFLSGLSRSRYHHEARLFLNLARSNAEHHHSGPPTLPFLPKDPFDFYFGSCCNEDCVISLPKMNLRFRKYSAQEYSSSTKGSISRPGIATFLPVPSHCICIIIQAFTKELFLMAMYSGLLPELCEIDGIQYRLRRSSIPGL